MLGQYGTQGALAVSTVAGGGGAARDGEGVSPEGNFVNNLLDNDEPRSRPELMQTALQSLEQARAVPASSPRLAPADKDNRTAWANDTWLKMYAILDYVRCTHFISVMPGFG